MDDLLENTTVIPLVQFLAHICRVFVSMVGLPRVLRPSTTTTMQCLGLESTSSREYEFFLFVCGLAAIPGSASSSSSSDGDNTKQRSLQVPSRSKTRNAVRSAFWRKRAVVLVKSGVDLEIRI